jgi:hypothetical protein
VSVRVVDSFRKSSSIFNQPDFLSETPVSGSVQPSNETIIPPVADQLSNTGNVQLTYQLRANAMVGAGGSIADLHYPDPAQVPGLYDSTSRGGTAFYSHRLSGKHYLGLMYQYQLLRAFPTTFRAETRTDSAFFFYTAYLRPTFSLSLFGGPQYADTQESIAPSLRAWSPAAGASLAWQGQETSLAVSYSRTIASGGGLIGATHQNAANAAARRQLTRMLSVAVSGNYMTSLVLSPVASFSTGGHMVLGTASLQRQLGNHLNCEIGYTRLHQSYSDIRAISGTLDTNREWISIAYRFTRPLGR